MWTENKAARDELVRIMESEYPAHLAEVAAAFGVKATAPTVRRVTGNDPCLCVVDPPTMSGIRDTRDIVAGPIDCWVKVRVSVADAAERDKLLEAHFAALVTALSGDRIEVVDADTSPPGVEDNEQVQWVGVLARTQVAASR
jgi:hypothetical protein